MPIAADDPRLIWTTIGGVDHACVQDGDGGLVTACGQKRSELGPSLPPRRRCHLCLAWLALTEQPEGLAFTGVDGPMPVFDRVQAVDA